MDVVALDDLASFIEGQPTAMILESPDLERKIVILLEAGRVVSKISLWTCSAFWLILSLRAWRLRSLVVTPGRMLSSSRIACHSSSRRVDNSSSEDCKVDTLAMTLTLPVFMFRVNKKLLSCTPAVPIDLDLGPHLLARP